MVLGPLEVALIVALLVIFLRPKTMSDIARSFGRVVREYRKAASAEKIDADVMKIASALGVSIEGKSEEEVVEEIRKKLKSTL